MTLHPGLELEEPELELGQEPELEEDGLELELELELELGQEPELEEDGLELELELCVAG